jgi:hypothetical protein
MSTATYLVFGDLHGRVLPAFRLALVWQREHEERVAGLLQVGDLGYFPDLGRLDRATRKHARNDDLELGVLQVVYRNEEADRLFAEPDLPSPLWFTPGNHEDHEALEMLIHGAGCTADDFPVDYYQQIRCIRDGHVVETLPGGLRVGALWGIDDEAPRCRRNTPLPARIKRRSANQLRARAFDVLLSHDSPRDAVFEESGSEAISTVLDTARPPFAFFGHYHGEAQRREGPWPATEVYHLVGLEFRGRGGSAEQGSVGVLRWRDGVGNFEYVEPSWLQTITRWNWTTR